MYHPDANINNPNKAQAEEKFKEIQQAYQQIMKQREQGSSPYGNQGYGYGNNGYGNGGNAQNGYGGYSEMCIRDRYLPYYLLTGGALQNYVAVFVFFAGFIIASAGFVYELMKRYFKDQPFYLWAVGTGMFVGSYSMFYLLIRPDLYHVPIVASAMFATGGLWLYPVSYTHLISHCDRHNPPDSRFPPPAVRWYHRDFSLLKALLLHPRH